MSERIDPRVIKARTGLILKQPFYGTLALHLDVKMLPGIGTMATDGETLWIEPGFLDTLTEDELEGVVAHEVGHCANKHHTRRQGRDKELWNIAADHVVNLDLIAAKFTLPSYGFADERFRGLCTEEVYTILSIEQEQQRQEAEKADQDQASEGDDGGASDKSTGGQGGSGTGDGGAEGQDSGAGDEASDGGQEDASGASEGAGDQGPGKPGAGQPGKGGSQAPGQAGSGTGSSDKPGPGTGPAVDPGRMGGVIDAATPGDGAALGEQEATWDVLVRQALNVAAKQAGNMPGYLERLADETRKPRYPWQDELRKFIDSKIQTDYAWSRPNRRFVSQGYIFPGSVANGVNHVAMTWDVSGSIYSVPELLSQFKAEMQQMLDDKLIQKITLILCDTEVKRVYEFLSGDRIDAKIIGGGGTDFAPPFRYVEEEGLDISAMIYFTDLEGSFGPEPGYPVLWAVYPFPYCTPKPPPYGTVLPMTM